MPLCGLGGNRRSIFSNLCMATRYSLIQRSVHWLKACEREVITQPTYAADWSIISMILACEMDAARTPMPYFNANCVNVAMFSPESGAFNSTNKFVCYFYFPM